MEKIKDNTAYNLPTIKHFRELEKTKFSKGYSKTTVDFLYHFGADTYFYFYEDSPKRYYLIDGVEVGKLGLVKQTFEKFIQKQHITDIMKDDENLGNYEDN